MRTFRNLAGQDITEEQVLEEVKMLFGEDHDADELGTIFVNWDCGSGLGVGYGEDIIGKI